MIEKVLKNLAYTFYPKNLCSFSQREEYINSKEYQNLTNILKNFSSDEQANVYNILVEELQKYTFIKSINDVSLINWEDRCYTFEIDDLNENILNKIYIYISLIAPYYIVFLVANEIEVNNFTWKTYPVRNMEKENEEYKTLIDTIELTLEKLFKFNKFPEELINIVIPNLSFQDIRLGNFTLFNAFFLNESNIYNSNEI